MTFAKSVLMLWAILVTIITNIPICAGMSPLTFKNAGKCLKKSYEYYIQTLGSVALSSGLIESMRFYNIHIAYNKDGFVEHKNDKAPENDHIMIVVKILFPSTAGQLTSETIADTNFGRYCRPSHVAALFNFAHAVRMFYADEKNKGQSLGLIIHKILSKTKQVNSIKNSFGTEFDHTEKNALLVAIAEAILQELRPKKSSVPAFYPKFCVEQVISAFFCHKFADQGDLRDMLSELSEDIVDRTKISLIDRAITEDDFSSALKKIDAVPDTLDFDDLWLICNRNIFKRILPYENGKSPISNGLAKMYQRNTNTQHDSKEVADCVEVSLRHLLNMMLYDPIMHRFDLTRLEAYMADKDNPYLKNLQEFYAIQTPQYANAGNTVIRSAWNKVIADLGNNIRYLKKFDDTLPANNELDSGMLQILCIFKILLHLDFGDEPAYIAGQEGDFKNNAQIYIETGLKKLFNTLTDRFIYEISFQDISTRKWQETHDIFGRIAIKVINKTDGTIAFSFTVLVSSIHMDILDMIINEKNLIPLERNSRTFIQKYLTSIESKNTTLSSLMLIDSALMDLDIVADISPLYTLLGSTITDSNSIIKALSTMREMQTQANPQIDSKRANLILKNLLHNYPWNDPAMVEGIMPEILKFMELIKDPADEFSQILKAGVKGVIVSNESDVATYSEFFSNIESMIIGESLYTLDLTYYPNIKELHTTRYSTLENILFPDVMNNIKIINLSQAQIQNVSLPICPKLSTLNLSWTESLTSIIFPATMENLEMLDFSRSALKSLILPVCPNLKELNANSTKKLSEIVFTGNMDRLEELKMNYSAIKSLNLSTCSNVKILSLENTKKLETITLPNTLNSLKKFDLSKGVIKQLTLPACPNLDILRLESLEQLSELLLPSTLDNLEILTLKNIAIKSLSLPACRNVKALTLDETKYLTEIFIANNMDHLEELWLRESAIQKLTLPACPRLTKLILMNTKQLTGISFTGTMERLEELSLDQSAIRKLTLPACPNLEALDLNDTKNLTSVVFSGAMDSLKEIGLEDSSVEQIIGIEYCPKLDRESIPPNIDLFKTQVE